MGSFSDGRVAGGFSFCASDNRLQFIHARSNIKRSRSSGSRDSISMENVQGGGYKIMIF